MSATTALVIIIAGISPTLAADAPATDLESVLVETNSLDGVWKINVPTYSGGLSVLRGFRGSLRKFRTILCRVNDRTVRCIGPALAQEGSISVTGTHAHIAWGSAIARPVIDGNFASATAFSGQFAFKIAGFSHDAPDPATGTKISLSAIPASNDKEGRQLTRMLEELRKGLSSDMLDIQSKDVQLPPQQELHALGGVQSVAYLGESGEFITPTNNKGPTPDKYKIPTDYRVYDVEFENGERLCGLRIREDSKIDGLKCV
jgi:hypothetical protein